MKNLCVLGHYSNCHPIVVSQNHFIRRSQAHYSAHIRQTLNIYKMPSSNPNRTGAPTFNGLRDDWSSTDESSVQHSIEQANTAARVARAKEFSDLLERFQHTAPDSMGLLNQALHLMVVSPRSESWEAMSSSLPDLLSDDERANLVERKTVRVSELAANACRTVNKLRSNLLLETKTLFRLNKSANLGDMDFTKEVDDYETSLAALTLAVRALDAKLEKYNRDRFSQPSSSSDSPNQPDLNRAIGSGSSPLTPSSFVPEPASTIETSMTGMSSPIVDPLRRSRTEAPPRNPKHDSG